MTPSRPTFRTACTLIVVSLITACAATATDASRPQTGLRVVSSTLAHAPRATGYDWPIKPFDRQHPVRGFLNDPRIGDHGGRAFHFGIDIAAPDGTPVYAVEAGTVYLDSPVAVAVLAPGGSHSFGYWHIVPSVKNHQYVRRHELLGRIGKGWGHVHFAERQDGVYLNPLRPGGLAPYRDTTAPTISMIAYSHGTVVVDARDTPSPAVPGAWRGEPVTPSLLRWRAGGSGRWHTIADFRAAMLPAARFAQVYTPRTRQNHKGVAGRFEFYVARGAESRAIAAGVMLEIEASDTAGNRTVVEWLAV